MKKNVYKSAVDKINFDENLDSKIIDYLKINGSKGENVMKNNSKNKRKTSIAAACAVCLLSGATYASVMNFREVSHVPNGLVAQTNKQDEGNTKDLGEGEKLTDTKEQREQMEKGNVGYKVVSEEKANSNVKWNKKTILKDATSSYKSDDNKIWEVDKEASVSMMTEYVYDDYKTALDDANMPNIMKNLLSKVKINEEVTVDEYYTEESTEIIRKVVTGEFDYKTGNMNVEVSKHINNDGVSVITDINEVTNQREYETKDGTLYRLSDSVDGKVSKTTTIISKGDYYLIIQFKNLDDKDIETLLENIDLSTI